MPDRDRAAVDIEAFVGNAQPVAAVNDLHSERFVAFPQSDVLDAQTGLAQELGYGEYRSDAHFIGLTAGDLKASENAERFQAFLFCTLGVHDDANRGAVGKLACIACRDDAARQRSADLRHSFMR